MNPGAEKGAGLSQDLRAAKDERRSVAAAHAFASLQAQLTGSSQTVKVGRFELRAHLGTGGMGTVMKAFDPQLRRVVALKVLHETDDPKEHARLLEEARAMASLRHPNLVAVHEVGTHEGAVFLAMEYVEGGSLRQWLDAQPRDWEAIVQAYLGAARGLCAVHDAGLVHRDFKPDNVLINADGRTQVTDFGLALPVMAEVETDEETLETSQTNQTNRGAVGTPPYMAPEQWLGAGADAASDQWSFCVAFYEALHGRRPFEAGSTLAYRTAVLEGARAPLPPHPRYPAWLGRIVERGLSRDPGDRFASMQALTEALERHLAKHRTRFRGVAVVAGLGVASALGVAIRPTEAAPRPCKGVDTRLESAWTSERRDALAQRFSTLSAETSWAVLEEELDERVATWAAQRRDACEATHIRGEQSEAILDLRMLCLDRRATELETLLTTYDDLEAPRLRQALGGLGRLPPPRVCADVDALRAVQPLPEEPRARASVVALRERVAKRSVLLASGDMDEAPIDALVADALDSGYDPVVAEALLLQAKRTAQLGEGKAAAALYERAFDHALAGQDIASQIWVASILVHVRGDLLRDVDGARRWAERAAALLRAHPLPAAEAALENNRGTAAVRDGDLERARAHFERAVELFSGPDAPGFNLPGALANLAFIARRQGRFDDAIALLERARAQTDRLFGAGHPFQGRLRMTQGLTHLERGELDRAEALLREAVDRLESQLGPTSNRLADPLNNLAVVLMERGEFAAALPYLERVIDLRAAKDPLDPVLATVYANEAEVLLELGRTPDAMRALERANAVQPPEASADSEAVLLGLRAWAMARTDPQGSRTLAARASALDVDDDTRQKLVRWAQLR
ncbi:MAG: protein kinase domain-containing protein [Nannocystaceae bacterium]|nr:serine/threonine-protein kinase [bacterium]